MGALFFQGRSPGRLPSPAQRAGLGKDCHSGATPGHLQQVSAANGRGVAPLVVLHFFPARQAGLGNRRGVAPEIGKNTPVLTYYLNDSGA